MKNNLPPIACQLTHPDATFYSVVLDGDKVTGFFAAHDNNQPFEIPFSAFLESAYKCSVIADYADGQIYIPGDRTDRNARQWAEFWLVETAGTTDFFTVISDAVYSEFESELTRLAREAASGLVSSSVSKRIYRTVDADFCDAIKAISKIIEAVEVYEEEVEAANPQDYFTCKACNCKVPIEYQVRTQGFCYLCDPNISVEELEAANA